MIENWSSKLSRDEAYEQMRRNRIPVAPVRNLEEVRTNPHLHARGMLTYMDHPDMGEIVLPNSPMRFSDYDSSEVQFYPEVGVNNDDVYTNWLALSAEEIESLRQDHVI